MNNVYNLEKHQEFVDNLKNTLQQDLEKESILKQDFDKMYMIIR
jgi:hypothetical protein